VNDASSIALALAADDGSPSAPPRSNGELVFEAPWESRSFGMAVALSESRMFDWEQFRQRLIAEIGRWEREHAEEPGARWSYYECWLDSLQRLLVEDRLLTEEDVLTRAVLLERSDEHGHEQVPAT
jgi:nitrile hydratase accessory protein